MMIKQGTAKNNDYKLQSICKVNRTTTHIHCKNRQYIQDLTIDNLFIVIFENGKQVIENFPEGKAVVLDGSEITYYQLPQEEEEL
jgi:hypothetical protein